MHKKIESRWGTDKDAGERLSKRVAALVPCSRREAEQYIEGGWVRVDGRVVEEPQFRVLPQHTIALDPHATLLELTPVTLIMHKPPGWLDGVDDEPELPGKAPRHKTSQSKAPQNARTLLAAANHAARDASGIRTLLRHFKNQEAEVPLEPGASGLIVFSQDWRVLRKLTEDMGTMEHEVMVDVRGEVSEQALRQLQRELGSDRQRLPHTKVSINSNTAQTSKLRFAIKGAHPGLIAWLCEQAQLEITAMRRIRLGRVALGDLPVGQWRYLAPHERF
jgi:23S rRNA pseudouridine2604 synthase